MPAKRRLVVFERVFLVVERVLPMRNLNAPPFADVLFQGDDVVHRATTFEEHQL